METAQQIVILAAGGFPTHPVPLRALREAHFVVCCDSAYSQFLAFNASLSIPFIVIGDGDSLSADSQRQLGDRWLQVDEQDYNDLHKAMTWAAGRFPIHNAQFTILGATGRREDHTLGNISYLVTFAEEYPGADITMLTDHGSLCAVRGSRTFASFPRQQISIFAMNPAVPIYGHGLKWPLDAFHARRWWQATLNETLGSEFSLSSEDWLVLFRTYEPKD